MIGFHFKGYGDERDDEVNEFPSMEDLEEWTYDSVCEATDGCMVEPDGECEHRHLSWLRALGMT